MAFRGAAASVFLILTLLFLGNTFAWADAGPASDLDEVSPLLLTPEEKEWIESHRKITIGVDPGFAPFEFLDKAGVHKGMCADYVRILGKRLGLEFVQAPNLTWSEVIDYSKAGKIDVLPCVGITEERKAYLDYSEPYLFFPRVIITQIGAPFIKDLEDLESSKVGVQANSSHQGFLEENSNITTVPFETLRAALLALSQGKIDALVGNVASSAHLIQELNLNNLKIAAPVSSAPNTLHFAVRKDSPMLVGLINKGLASISKEDAQAIKNDWLSVRFEHGVDTGLIIKVALQVALLLLIVFIVIAIWNRRLKSEVDSRKKAEHELIKRRQELAQQRNILQTVLHSLPEGVVAFDQNLELLYWNDKYLSLRGYPKEMIKVGQSFKNLLRYDVDHQEFGEGDPDKIFDEKIELAGRFVDHNFERKRPDGRYINVRGGPIPGGGFVSTYTDITQKKQTEQALLEAKEIAEKANKAKSEFLSSMSHELRTPLNSILGFSQIMAIDDEAPLNEDQQESVEHIIKSGHHLLGLINDVLDLSKIESGTLEISNEGVDVLQLVKETGELIRSQANARGITVHEEAGPVFLKGDYMKIKQVMLNFLSNAVKYNRDDGDITFVAEQRENGKIRISVRDTGHGIAPENKAALFEPFNRLGQESGNIEGTGIGLSITKRLVELMGGEIGVDSVLGEGSTFWAEFDEASEESLEEVESAIDDLDTSPAAPARGQHTILYVEDNPANMKLMRRIMEKLPQYKFLEATNAEDGLEIAFSQKPEIILMDISLPGASGFEALEVLQEKGLTDEITVIALSANVMSSDVEKGIKAGFFAYLTKPFDVKELVKTLESAIDRP